MREFLLLATRHLAFPIETKPNPYVEEKGTPRLRSWCSWTTFSRLQDNADYWTAELPLESELGEFWTEDGGTWGQPFPYHDLSHVIIPRHFIEETISSPFGFQQWSHEQDLIGLSDSLASTHIRHRVSRWALEAKIY